MIAAPAPRPEWADPASFFLAIVVGAALFGRFGRHGRPALAGGIAIGALLAMTGGAVPVVNGRRAAELWVGFAALETGGGGLLAPGYRRLVAPRIPVSST